MSGARPLTGGEIGLARQAFGGGIDYPRVRFRAGPGRSLAARIAFAKGNPAITLGSTVYFKRGFVDDFAASGANPNSFMHELTHVWQYQRLGVARFLVRYGAELVRVGGRPAAMYLYKPGETRFGEAMLEAQAQMVGDYSEARWKGREREAALLARNLAGSGIYGL